MENTVDTQTSIDARKARNARHNPWDNLSGAERDRQLSAMGARPIKWTTDIALVNKVTDDGYVYVFAGGPFDGSTSTEPRKRADGKIDGRSKGARKCGKCGEHGHNARTCGAKRKGPASLPASLRKPVPSPSEIRSADPLPVPGVSKATVSKAAPETPEPTGIPAPRKMAPKAPASKANTAPMARASIKVPGKKTCGKCGVVGHNARTCGKGARSSGTISSGTVASQAAVSGRSRGSVGPKASKAPRASQGPQKGVRVAGSGKTGRLNKCGKCGGMGHNARGCKA